ncbi:MAG: YajQ family cyclic di-GMP-binding protein [Dehalococcoidia bacterium]|nr:YajQ family cyclic di-GMP-binding protein [Dehalococcoidia bacterium]
MAKDQSFDITTGVDLQEVDNALNQARKEIVNRFDFKNVLADIEYDRDAPKITIHTADDYKLEAIWQVMVQRFTARDVPLKNLERGKVEQASGGTVRQEVTFVQGLDSDLAKKITKFIRDQKFKKANAQVQGDTVRVSSPSRDELQSVMNAVKGEDWGIELNFGNYR